MMMVLAVAAGAVAEDMHAKVDAKANKQCGRHVANPFFDFRKCGIHGGGGYSTIRNDPCDDHDRQSSAQSKHDGE